MNRKQPSSRDLQSLRAEASPEDGADPKLFFRHRLPNDKIDRKTLQLCSQVAQTLRLVLAADGGDDWLSELEVVSVAPAPNASQLLVVVTPRTSPGPTTAAVYQQLARQSARLRAEVAAAITRRRAPKLRFQFVPYSPTRGERSEA